LLLLGTPNPITDLTIAGTRKKEGVATLVIERTSDGSRLTVVALEPIVERMGAGARINEAVPTDAVAVSVEV
jgi:hypothetical protein